MRSRVLTAITWGFLITLALSLLSLIAVMCDAPDVARLLYWQIRFTEVSLLNIGTEREPIYEATLVNVLSPLFGFPLGMIVYSAAAFAFGFLPGRPRHASARS